MNMKNHIRVAISKILLKLHQKSSPICHILIFEVPKLIEHVSTLPFSISESMSEKEEYAAETLFPDPQQLRCIAYRTVRQPTLHGSLMTHQAIANGQQMHNRHALQMNSVALWQNLDFELSEEEEKYDVEEEEERQEQE